MLSSGRATPALSIANIIYMLDKICTLKHGVQHNECSIRLTKNLNDWLFQVEELVEAELVKA